MRKRQFLVLGIASVFVMRMQGQIPVYEIPETVITPIDTTELVKGNRFKPKKDFSYNFYKGFEWGVYIGDYTDNRRSASAKKAILYLTNIRGSKPLRSFRLAIVSTQTPSLHPSTDNNIDTLWAENFIPKGKRQDWYSFQVPNINLENHVFIVFGGITTEKDKASKIFTGPMLGFTNDVQSDLTWIRLPSNTWKLDTGRTVMNKFNALMFVVTEEVVR